jgi:hypothetical protein
MLMATYYREKKKLNITKEKLEFQLTCFFFDFTKYLKKSWFKSTLIKCMFPKKPSNPK